jgi:hypothetical protein
MRHTKKNNAVEDGADSGLHGDTGVGSLQTNHGKTLHSSVWKYDQIGWGDLTRRKHTREGSLSKHSPETEEAGFRLGDDAKESVVERLIPPVAEATAVMVGCAAEVNDKAHENQADDGDDLNESEH